MIIKLNHWNIKTIENPYFAKYAKIYEDIYQNYMEQIKRTEIHVDTNFSYEVREKIKILRQKGAIFRNNDKSIYVNYLSPACKACAKGDGSITMYLSLMCHRNCFFCFNPNQEKYEYYRKHKKDCIRELENIYHSNDKVLHLALSGGEPLLHRDDTIRFFKLGRQMFPQTHTRLYTSGDLADEDILRELGKIGLDEIRFSIKMDDPINVRHGIYEKINLARKYIPSVMVEMPVFPDTLEEMKKLLLDLNKLGITGINLLEFCFPFNNTHKFNQRDYKIKNPPIEILYDYSYAAGLPISRSEIVCLDLMEFIIDQNLKIGAHYCSLENKLSEQVYKQNYGQKISPIMYFSEKDFFFKSAKVFGKDIEKVLHIFTQKGVTQYQINKQYQFIEFNVANISYLKNLNIEIGISLNVIEKRNKLKYLRELKIDLTYPGEFDIQHDI